MKKPALLFIAMILGLVLIANVQLIYLSFANQATCIEQHKSGKFKPAKAPC